MYIQKMNENCKLSYENGEIVEHWNSCILVQAESDKDEEKIKEIIKMCYDK